MAGKMVTKIDLNIGMHTYFCEQHGVGPTWLHLILGVSCQKLLLGQTFGYGLVHNWPHLFLWACHYILKHQLCSQEYWSERPDISGSVSISRMLYHKKKKGEKK